MPRSKQTLRLILIPMLATFACQRLYLHFIGINHVHPAGIVVHHLFIGVMVQIPAAFIIAFGFSNRAVAVIARVALGIGSAMILDEIVYLVATKATDADYVSPISLWGAVIFMSLATALL